GGVGLGVLGIIDKPASDGTYVLQGLPLHGDMLSKHAYLVNAGADKPTLTGVVNLSAADIDAAARLNLTPVTLGNGAAATTPGTGNSRQQYTLVLKDPNNDGRLTFSEFAAGLQDLSLIADAAVRSGTAS